MSAKKHLTAEVATRLQAAAEGATPDQDKYWETLATEARVVLGDKIDTYTEALTRACIKLKHPGSSQITPSKEGVPCSRCQLKIRAYRECSALIHPDG